MGDNGQPTDTDQSIEFSIPRLLYECCKMGWTPQQFYAETLADIQLALAAHYDRVEHEQTQMIALARRMTYFIVNTSGYVKKEIPETHIMELPHEREERLARKEQNAFSPEEVQWWIDKWKKEGPGIENGEDAWDELMAMAK